MCYSGAVRGAKNGFAVGVALLCLCAAVSCADNRHYLVGAGEERRYLRWLWSEMEEQSLRTPQGIAALEFYFAHLVAEGYADLAHRLVVTRVHADVDNPYNGAILLLLAEHYAAAGNVALASYYYDQIVANYPGIEYDRESTHFRALVALVSLVNKDAALAEYYRMLIYRFPEKIDVFLSYQRLGVQYQRLANWPLLFEVYRELVDFCDANAAQCRLNLQRIEYLDTVRAALRFFESNHYWTAPSLELLVAEIKNALAARSVSQLLSRQAQVNFFARSWEQDEFDFNSQINFNVGIFLSRSQVRFEDEVDSISNAQEAYLRTWGWSHRIPTWYFYFRKVDFPADLEVHGDWEWAGIFFGELL